MSMSEDGYAIMKYHVIPDNCLWRPFCCDASSMVGEI